jgi:hypothetical protein
MNIKTTLTGILAVVWNLAAGYGLEVDPALKDSITTVLIAVALYFAKDATSEEV